MLFSKRAVFSGFLTIVLFSHAAFAEAGLLSFLGGIFGSGGEDLNRVPTSQNIPLLQAAVNHDPNPSKGGGDITIVEGRALMPESGPLGTLADIDSVIPRSDQISVYVVREGDSLSQIANMFGVSVNTVVWANDIKRGNVIREGQTLVILPVSGIRHTVAKGDTIQSIAAKYKADAHEILDYNGFSENVSLAAGDEIIVPKGTIQAPTFSSSENAIPRGAGGPVYAGYYLRPISGGTKSQGVHGYNAVDLAAPIGTPILASATGEIVISRNGWNGGYGNYIVIAHGNGTQTLYAHNTSNIVTPGQRVVQGQVIGYVGATGRVTGPHVHFEVRGAVNPF